MTKYRIKVEALEPNSEVHEDLLNGVVCDGYFLCTSQDDGNTISINDVNTIDMAIAIAKSTELLQAAMIAHSMEEARLMKENRKMSRAQDLLDALLRQ